MGCVIIYRCFRLDSSRGQSGLRLAIILITVPSWRRLLGGVDFLVCSVSNFRRRLRQSLAESTTRLMVNWARQFIRAAGRGRLIAENPFGELKGLAVRAVEERQAFTARKRSTSCSTPAQMPNGEALSARQTTTEHYSRAAQPTGALRGELQPTAATTRPEQPAARCQQ